MERYLLDTSAVIKYLNESLPTDMLSFLDQQLDEESNISFITQIELLVWKTLKPKDLEVYQTFVDQSQVIMINPAIIQQTIFIRRETKIKIPDAIIAATAMVHNYTLVGDNDKDFDKVVDLEIGLRYLCTRDFK